MIIKSAKLTFSIILILLSLSNILRSDEIKKIEFFGNDRIPNETILMFSEIKIGDNIDEEALNQVLINLYNSNFFKDVKVELVKNILKITVSENPLIEQIKFEGIKAKKILESIKEDLLLKSRTSYNEVIAKNDLKKMKSNLKGIGYFFSEVDLFVEDLDNNKVNLVYKINLGNKSKIKKIKFIGDKRFKDSKLKNVIISEEYKFWKFVSGRKYLNENVIEFDKRLLTNFYLNKGYYNVKINSSFAKLLEDDSFELIYNIESNDKFYFNNLKLNLPTDYNYDNFNKIDNLFKKLKGEPYSLNSVNNIIEEIELIVLDEQFESTTASVEELIESDKINLTFNIQESERYNVERINIYGNNITREDVIRNNMYIDEGDIFNEILTKKSENNLKALNIFKTAKIDVIKGSSDKSKIIEIEIEEKATGEVMAGAGFGTSGAAIQFGVKENNYLGRGVKFNSDLSLSEDSIKGSIGVTNPNFNNSDKSVSFSLESSETDKLNTFGYKTNKSGFAIATNFEYFKNLNFGLGTSSFYESIETDSTASIRQKKMEGDYWDTFIKLNLDYDKRNQKYRTSKGFRSFYNLDLPVISETSTLTNTYDYKYFTELFEDNITTAGFLIKSANSIVNEDIKLSERLFVPSRKLRGFEYGKVGPKDGDDYIGGNYLTSINFNTTIPQLFPNAQNFDFLFFVDAANVWGVDYDSSIDNNNSIRSSIGLSIDWMTVVGPLNFSLAQPITKSNTDVTETFRFNLGTTF